MDNKATRIINLTHVDATPEQIAEGVFEPLAAYKPAIQAALTFDAMPSPRDINIRARLLATIAQASGARYAMVGDAPPYMISAIEHVLNSLGICPVYSFSVRESKSQRQPDGSFKTVWMPSHAGFVFLPCD